MSYEDLKKNKEGYLDPTAYEALKKVMEEDSDKRFNKLLHTIFDACDLAGFKLTGRITLIDKASGKIYK